jgi:hypothetical protein
MRIRLHGTEAECMAVAGRLGQVLGVLSVSEPYPDRGVSRLVRVYVEARLDPLPDLVAEGAGPLLDPDCRDGKHASCIGAPCECTCHQAGDQR